VHAEQSTVAAPKTPIVLDEAERSHDGPLDRAIAILTFVAEQKKAVSAAEIAAALSLPLPTAHRLIGNLEQRGLIQKALGTKRYVVGNKLVTLSAKAIGSAFRTARRHAVLSAVADQIGEQCEIGVVRDNEVAYVDSVRSKQPQVLKFDPGHAAPPLHCTSTGKIYMSRLPLKTRERLVRSLNLVADAAVIAGYFSIGSDIFLRMIKMIIAPLVFATIVSGIASLGVSGGAVGRIAFRALAWFISASLVSLLVGLLLASIIQPGRDLGLALPGAGATANVQAGSLTLKDFASHVFPTSVVQAMAGNEVLQILVFSIFFGFALANLKGTVAKTISASINELVPLMLRFTDYVMRFAPLGVFAAMAAVITTQGLGVLVAYGKFVSAFYFALLVLWVIIIGAGTVVLQGSMRTLLKLLRQPMAIAFSTSSSEAAFPKMIEQLMKFGVSERIAGFVLPLGYSFNLDGSMMYQTFAALFVAQAFGIELSMATQITMLLVLMITTKGIAGVPRASLVVVAATLPMFNLPTNGLVLLVGIDQFLDMGRTMTNVIGNGVATAVVAKWENELARPAAEDLDIVPAAVVG
jgi:Na+/H+-dicarboxylate symporter